MVGQGVEFGADASPQDHWDLRRKRPQKGQGATSSGRREWSTSTRSRKIRAAGPSLPRDCDQRGFCPSSGACWCPGHEAASPFPHCPRKPRWALVMGKGSQKKTGKLEFGKSKAAQGPFPLSGYRSRAPRRFSMSQDPVAPPEMRGLQIRLSAPFGRWEN